MPRLSFMPKLSIRHLLTKFAIDFLEIWSFSFLNFSLFCPARDLVAYLINATKSLRTYQRVVKSLVFYDLG